MQQPINRSIRRWGCGWGWGWLSSWASWLVLVSLIRSFLVPFISSSSSSNPTNPTTIDLVLPQHPIDSILSSLQSIHIIQIASSCFSINQSSIHWKFQVISDTPRIDLQRIAITTSNQMSRDSSLLGSSSSAIITLQLLLLSTLLFISLKSDRVFAQQQVVVGGCVDEG